MARVKRGTQHTKRRRNLLAHVKGFKWGRNSKIKLARPAFLRAGAHAYRDRRRKKREFRKLWNTRINASARLNGTTYSRFINALKQSNVELDRKVLSEIGEKHPTVFTKIVEAVKK